jgi:hypothetical protein
VNTKMLTGVIGAAALVAMGALTLSVHEQSAGGTPVAMSGMQRGETTTMTTPPVDSPMKADDVQMAKPVVKAKPYHG